MQRHCSCHFVVLFSASWHALPSVSDYLSRPELEGSGPKGCIYTTARNRAEDLAMISQSLLLPSTAALAVGLLAQTAGFAQIPTSTAVKSAVTPAIRIPPGGFQLFPYVFPGQVALEVDTLPANQEATYYLAAPNGGGRTIDALVTSATGIGPNERFTVEQTPGSQYLNFITAGGDFVSVPLPYGSNLTRTTQTVLTAPADSTLFYLNRLDYFGDYNLETYYGDILYFVNDGGRSTAAIATYSVSSLPPTPYDEISPQQCGDLGSGYKYSIQTGTVGGGLAGVGITDVGLYHLTLGAIVGDEYSNAYSIGLAEPGEVGAQFTLIQQDDGSYALQTSNGAYVAARDGGGLDESDDLLVVTNPPQGDTWEKFWITDQGNCTYTIRTSSGYYLAWNITPKPNHEGWHINPNEDYALKLSTDISDPAAAPSVGYSAYFVLRPLWN
jgi:hypothetical protein